MPIRCPHCGHEMFLIVTEAVVVSADDLTPAARRILDRLSCYQKGQRISIERMAFLSSYSTSHTQRALAELATQGECIERRKLGPRKSAYYKK